MEELLVVSEKKLLSDIGKYLDSGDFKNIKLKSVDNLTDLSIALTNSENLDLIIADSHINGGSTLEYFRKNQIETPIILVSSEPGNRFQVLGSNVIDFISKPLKSKTLANAISNYQKIKSKYLRKLKLQYIDQPQYKKRFVAKIGDRLLIKKIEDIAAFYTKDKLTYLITAKEGKPFLIDYTLDDLDDGKLEPLQYFRINRQYIISIDSIKEIKSHPNRRLRVELSIPVKNDLIVSRERVSAFKMWITQ